MDISAAAAISTGIRRCADRPRFAQQRYYYDVDEIQFVPQATSPIASEGRATFEKLLAMLDECEDVQRVYHSAEL